MFSLNKKKKGVIALALASTVLFAAESCEGDTSAAGQAGADRDKAVEGIRKEQPVSIMNYSPTLQNINRWADTWGEKGKVAYVYMKRADGTFDGYYVMDGLPTNYCVGGSPPYAMEDLAGDENTADIQVPAPGLDGAYYGGCDPSRYYGFDAVTGQYIEYTDGMVLTAVLSDQPLPQQVPAYVSTIADVKADQ